MLNAISDFYFRAHRSRIFTVFMILLLMGCIALMAAAQPEVGLDLRVYEFNEKTSITASMDRYFDVQGRLMPEGRYQTARNIGPLQLTGSRYIPIEVAGRDEPIFVLDENIPTPNADGQVSFVGQLIAAGDPAINYFLEVGRPTDVPLINRIARVALIVACLLVLGLLVGWLVRRANYALAAGGTATAASGAPEWMWFGSLGARFQNAYVRQGGVRLNATAQNLTFESTQNEPWAVVVHRAQAATPLSIATRYGPLPAIRMVFEDERGLIRKGVVTASTAQARDNLLQRLSTKN